MRAFASAARAVTRNGLVQTRVFITDRVNVLRKAYLPLYFLILALTLIVGWFWPESSAASNIAWFGVIACAILSYLFGLGLVVGSTAYKVAKRFARRFGIDTTNTPNLLDVWYWQAFVAMWTTSPLVALALLEPWKVGRSFQLIAGIFLILHVVATQRDIGQFWRRVYATAATAIVATIIFSIVDPGDWARIKGTHQRGQEQSFYEEGYQTQIASTLLPQFNSVNKQLAGVYFQINQATAAGQPVSADLYAQKVRLETVRDSIKDQIETQSKWFKTSAAELTGTVDTDDDQTMSTIMLGLFLVGILMFVATREKAAH